MELTLYDCSITSHNSADACSHLFLSSIRHKLESKLETLDTQSPNQSWLGNWKNENPKHKFWLQISSPQMKWDDSAL
jgi:hypothetical protein